MTSAKPSPLTSPMATDEPGVSLMFAASIVNPFDPSRSVTSMTDGIPGIATLPDLTRRGLLALTKRNHSMSV